MTQSSTSAHGKLLEGLHTGGWNPRSLNAHHRSGCQSCQESPTQRLTLEFFRHMQLLQHAQALTVLQELQIHAAQLTLALEQAIVRQVLQIDSRDIALHSELERQRLHLQLLFQAYVVCNEPLSKAEMCVALSNQLLAHGQNEHAIRILNSGLQHINHKLSHRCICLSHTTRGILVDVLRNLHTIHHSKFRLLMARLDMHREQCGGCQADMGFESLAQLG